MTISYLTAAILGKRYSSATGDVGELAGVLRFYAGFADKLYGQGNLTQISPLSTWLNPLMGLTSWW